MNEPVGLRIARDRSRLRDLEAYARAGEAALLELLDDERQKLLIGEALTREIDGTQRQPLALVRLRNEPRERLRNDPAIDGGHQAVTLGGGDEQPRRDELTLLVAHPDQQLIMRAGLGVALQRLNRLPEYLEALLVERVADACGPLHLLAPLHQIDVVFLIVVDAIPPGFLGRCASAVGRRQQRRNVVGCGGDRHDSNADSEAERAIVPRETIIADVLAERLGR